ncbi:MAG TPA: hypothetical protein VFZ61_04505 [Polyangiales bacterium]
MSRPWLRPLGAALAATLLGCGAIEERDGRREVDRFSALLLVDPHWIGPTQDAETELPTLPEVLAPLLGAEESNVALSQWLDAWADESDAPPAFRADLLCPWLRADATNGCDATCAFCVERRLDAASEPFRLIALAYRPDLALVNGSVRGQGELRLVYAVTRARQREVELPMSVIVELPLAARVSARQWAERFHALSALRDDPRLFRRGLRVLVDDARAVDAPASVNVRVRDALHSDGRMLAFRPHAGRLRRASLQDTIDLALQSTRELEATFASARADGAGALEVPEQLWAERVDRHSGWPQLADAKLSRALRLQSCHGCHADEHSLDGFHIAPGAVGRARVSRFLHDPEDLANDELSRREDALRTLLAL